MGNGNTTRTRGGVMPKDEQSWLCVECGNRITTFVKVSEPPVCSRHLKPVRMAETYKVKWGRQK
jgi:hypothetical protein